MKKGYMVPVKEKFAYGVGDLAVNVGFGAIGFYMAWFIVNVGGISPFNAIAVITVSKFWDAISDYLMGRISDKTRSRWGRRRPYIIFGSIPMAISFMLLWIVPTDNETKNLIYFIVMYIFYNTAFTIVAVPYNALLPELTSNYNERGAISGFKMGSSFIGTLVGAAGIPLLCWELLPQKDSAYLTNKANFPIMGVVFGCIIFGVLLVTGFGTKERIHNQGATNHEGFFKTLSSFMKLKEFRIVLGMFLFNMIGFDVIMSVIPFYLGDVLGIKGDISDMQMYFMAIPLIAAVAAAPLWVMVMNKLGKRRAYILSAIYFIFAMILCLFIPAMGDEAGRGTKMVILGIVTAFIGVGISASQVIPWAMLPDVIEIDEHKNGVRREGAFYGISTFLYKLASALAIAIILFIIGSFGYKQAPLTMETVKNDFIASYPVYMDEDNIAEYKAEFDEIIEASYLSSFGKAIESNDTNEKLFDDMFKASFMAIFDEKMTILLSDKEKLNSPSFNYSGEVGSVFDRCFSDAFVQPESALTAVRMIMSFLPGLFFAISAVFVFIFPLNKERFDKILADLEERKKNKLVEDV